jgi:hypothetical protein
MFFPDVVGIRTGDPVFGAFPADAEVAKRIADRFSTDGSAGDAYGEAHLGGQLQRPDARLLAKGARTLMQERSQPLAALFIEDLLGRVRTRGFGLERSQSSLVKIVNGVTNRLIATADETGNAGRLVDFPSALANSI